MLLLIWNEKPSLSDSPSDLLMHFHYNVNLLVFITTAAYFGVIRGLYKFYDQYYTTKAPMVDGNQVISFDRSFLVQDGNILEADDHVLESRNKLSDLEKLFGDENFRRCFGLLVYLFPIDYEFGKKDIIQLWMAEGFIQPSVETNELLEDAASVYFDVSSAASIFQSSRSDGNSRPRYRLNHSLLDQLFKLPSDLYCKIESGKPVSLSENTLHTSLICDSSDPVAFEALYQSKRLCTLLLVHEQRYSSINQVPYNLFFKLPLLRALDLSGMNITELPSSVGNLKHLRLLNLSKTLVKRLPESLCSLYLMQTMILRDCSKLVGLPKGMRKLVNLRHLDLDIASLLISMPPGIGDLTELQTLSAFIVGKDDGCHITELKHIANLRGNFGIRMLENISNSGEAKEAALDRKKYLERLELQWTELQGGVDEVQVLQHLQPHENLKELQIVSYGGTKFPGWIGNPVFSKLATITLHNCSKCEVLPSLGKLPLLKRLQISEMHAVKTIDTRFCGRDMVTPLLDLVLRTFGRHTNLCKGFPSLNNLRISGMPTLEKWSGMEEGNFSLLRKLSLSHFAKLTALPELSVLKALQELEISLCPVLQFLPKKSLPISLQSLLIISCPLLKERCHKEGHDWKKIAHIPSIWLDNQQIL
ncbi:hypothetical protein AQUCO_00400744v1 [Aquilegia coerulea]|uniref:NB-ARC domain-containing protein n=1 Tax=Aquilegia coerulea TaxID=218851 RepID=A0A2G5EWG1_AQUCA|nr:hypothetical protein AQUCO_00400744v1 [Aquilegia coerulea]